jgi:flagellar biosynthesis/type III secretory pathway protein FliH
MIGKIYKISCKTDPNLIYVGSTTLSLWQRLRYHKNDCKKMSRNAKLYQQINDNDWSNWEIELIEEVEFEDKKKLYEREGHYIQSIGTLNTYIAGRDDKQYREDNRDKARECQKQWRKDNRQYQKQYRQQNKEEINKYHRDAYNAKKHYRHTLLKKCFNAFKNHRADYIDGQDDV